MPTVVVVPVVVLKVVEVEEIVVVVIDDEPVVGVVEAVELGVDVAVDVGDVVGVVDAVPGGAQNSSVCSSSGITRPSGHGSQYWLAILLSKFRITSSILHVNVVYRRQLSSTWSSSGWYLPASQTSHVLFAVIEAAYRLPVLQVGC